ncbi:MAG: hypothetical protein E7028_10645 [Planctomycetaceae bacterium]|nr:hypothetical protein [Planctomycetaceae bacterium]
MTCPHQYQIITDSIQLAAWCEQNAEVDWIGIDTEFIAERYYQPLLCLIQAATPNGYFLIDPLTNSLDVTPFWELVANGPHETIVHAGRLELEFCWRYTNLFPKKVFDTQIAAGLISNEYPAGYGNIVAHFLNINMPGTESRSNWKSRPLTERQLEYAVDDIAYLNNCRTVLYEKLEKLGRVSWFRDEMEEWLSSIRYLLSPERWRRILNGSRWDPHELEIVRSLWNWRENLARQRNCSVRHVLRDDLILEMARRKIADVRSIRNIRGMDREDLRKHLPEISECISESLRLADQDCPRAESCRHTAKLTILGSLLYSVLGSICHQHDLAPGLVGTPTDVRDWVAWHLKIANPNEPFPALANGWRAEIIGKTFEALLSGKQMIRIANPLEAFPIEFVSVKNSKK